MMLAARDTALARARTLVDDRFGVVRRMLVHEVGPSDVPVFCATAELASTAAFSDGEASRLNGGAGLDADTALMGALGESIERYAIGLYREAELTRAPYREVAGAAVDPRHLLFFSDEQYAWPHFPYRRFDSAAPLSWVHGTTVAAGVERLVPAARVYTPYRAPTPAERLMQSTSTGAACHVDHARATLAGLYECIERDAVMIAWLNRLPLPRLDLHALACDRRVARVLAWLADATFTVTMLDATTDVAVPTALCVLYGPEGTAPAAAVGAATRATMAAAAEKALVESAHTFFWIHTRHRDGAPSFRDDFTDVTTLDLHSLRYGDPAVRNRLAFLSGEVPPAVDARKRELAAASAAVPVDVADELARCVAALVRLGMEPVVIDVTPSDIAARGFAVVRVVVPDLHPLWGGHHLRCLGGARVREVPVRLGYRDRPIASDELNRDPHPMP